MPYGGGFAFNNAVELPIVIDNRETELSAAVEWASHQGMFHVGYEHDKFNQSIPSFTFDNPQRATDYCRYGNPAGAPGTCYDPSGYVNGNGPAFGRMSQPPSNSVDTVNWMGMVKLPRRTTANASFTMGANHQDAALIPWTTNSTIMTPEAYAAFPGLAALPRDTAQMRVNYATGTMNVSSRAIKNVTLSARYRFNSRNDFTREFDAIEYVRFDAVPEETGGASEAFNINRNTLDVSAAYTGIAYSTIRVGYGLDQVEHGVRATQGYRDNTARISYDFVGNQYVMLRAQYEHSKRDTIGLSVEDIIGTGSQPDLRFYDEAARKRDRTTIIAEVTPISTVGLDFTLFHGKDDYAGADGNQEFGLLDNKNTGWTAGLNYAPSMKVNLGADYGRETYNALQESRNANPAPDPSWTDPSRNWSLSSDETVNTFTAYANLVKLLAKTDIRASYDLSDSDQAFVHGGPRIASLAAANQFVPFPNVTNKWQRATIDVSYSVSNNLGLGASYWYEKLDVQDYATIDTAGPQTLPVPGLGAQTDTPRIDWLGSHHHRLRPPPVQGADGVRARVLQLLDSVPGSRPGRRWPLDGAAAAGSQPPIDVTRAVPFVLAARDGDYGVKLARCTQPIAGERHVVEGAALMRSRMMAGAALVAGAWLVLGGVASATMPLQKKAKEAGFPATNCQYCHVDKLPKKDKGAHEPNDRGKWLIAQKEAKKAKEVDVTWLKDYVEKK